jgi:transcriptional regulator with XRE-family HTH domain
MGRARRWKPARLGNKLLRIRNALGLSQNGMIRRLGFTELLYRANISSYEVEGREPPLPVLMEYARVAGVTMETLVDDALDLPETLPVPSAQKKTSKRQSPRSKPTTKKKQRR